MLHLTPAHHMPWPVISPFRMRPGLARLAGHGGLGDETPALFLRDAQASAYAAHKQAVLAQHRGRGLVGQADPAVLHAIAQAYAAQTGTTLAPEADALARGMQEDFVILHDEPELAAHSGFVRPTEGVQAPLGQTDERATMRTRFLSVCFPSNWNPAEKHGLDFAAIHAPVADNALLQAGGQGIIDMAFRQASMLRHVWLLTPNGDLPQHPESRRTRWEDAIALADAPGASGRLLDQVFFRVERQTTLPLPTLRRGVFFIRVLVCPLVHVLRPSPERAEQLAQALASMSDAVLAYRGMAAVRPRLLDELARCVPAPSTPH